MYCDMLFKFIKNNSSDPMSNNEVASLKVLSLTQAISIFFYTVNGLILPVKKWQLYTMTSWLHLI